MSKHCIDCEDRTPNCHSKCPEYLEFRDEINKRNSIIRASKEKRGCVIKRKRINKASLY